MKFITVLLFLLSMTCFALVPSPESLLRNNNNGYIAEKYSMVAFAVKALDLNGKVESEGFYKFIYENGDSRRVNMLQVEYASSQMDDSQVIEARHFSNLEKNVGGDKNISRKLFYSLMHSLTTNDSSVFSRSLRSIDSSFPLNSEILNQEKLRLLESQKRFLAQSKKDSGFKDKNFSPLSPEGEAEKLKVQELLKQSTYKDTGLVALDKVQDKYFWSVKTNLIHGLFSATDYRLHRFEVKHDEDVYSFENTNYILFDGTHEYPKVIKIVGNNSRVYTLQILKSEHYNLAKLDFAAKAQSLAKSSKANKSSANLEDLFY
jgi:hypothetical protein